MSTQEQIPVNIVPLVGEKRDELIGRLHPYLDEYIICQIKLQQMRLRKPFTTEGMDKVFAEMQQVQCLIENIIENFEVYPANLPK